MNTRPRRSGYKPYSMRTQDGKPLVMSSSVRGMLRSAYEAITNSHFGVFAPGSRWPRAEPAENTGEGWDFGWGQRGAGHGTREDGARRRLARGRAPARVDRRCAMMAGFCRATRLCGMVWIVRGGSAAWRTRGGRDSDMGRGLGVPDALALSSVATAWGR